MIYYFGCWNQPGHFLHNPSGMTVHNAGPFTDGGLDGYYPPSTGGHEHRIAAERGQRPAYQDETIAALVHTKGWTVLAMWDRSLDTRYACNAAFLTAGEHTHAEMWALARQHYPQIVKRLKAAPVVDAVAKGLAERVVL